MTDRLICAIDCGASSRGVARAALATGEALAMRVVFVHVVDPSTASEETTLERASAELEHVLAGLPVPSDAIRRLEVGDPAAQVVAAARDEQAEVIVTGTRATRGRAKGIFGSVAATIVERAPVPVVIASSACCESALAGEPPTAREVVIGVDGSERGFAAARIAGAFARRARADIVLAHVVAPVTAAAPPVGLVPPIAPEPELAAHEVLERARALIPSPDEIELEVRHGRPAAELEQLACERSAVAIALGSSRPHRLKQLLLGSTGDRLAAVADRLLLVVPHDLRPAGRNGLAARLV